MPTLSKHLVTVVTEGYHRHVLHFAGERITSFPSGLQALQAGESLEKALKKYLANHHEAKEESRL